MDYEPGYYSGRPGAHLWCDSFDGKDTSCEILEIQGGKGMLLAVDVGNTNMVFGIYEENRLAG